MVIAQCLYVLTDENAPIIDEVRSNAEYTACLLEIVRSSTTPVKANGKDKDTSDAKLSALRVLCCGTSSLPHSCPVTEMASRYSQERLAYTAPIHSRNCGS